MGYPAIVKQVILPLGMKRSILLEGSKSVCFGNKMGIQHDLFQLVANDRVSFSHLVLYW